MVLKAPEKINFMPNYQLTPFKAPPQLFMPGQAAYVRGSWSDKTGPTLGNVISDSGTGSVSTVTFKITSGNIPVVGALISIVGSQNAAGGYNVVNAILTSVSAPASPDEGVYTVQFSNTASSASASDSGMVQIPQPEVPEALAAGASVPCVVPYNIMNANLNEAITVVVSFPSLPTSVIVYLQQAIQDLDAEYATVATVATVAGGTVSGNLQTTIDPTLGRFFRLLNGTVVGGTLPTIIAKMMI